MAFGCGGAFFVPYHNGSDKTGFSAHLRKIADRCLVRDWLPYSLFLNHFCSAASIPCIDSVENTYCSPCLLQCCTTRGDTQRWRASTNDSDDGDVLGGAFAGLELVPDTLTYTRCTVEQHNDRSWRVAYAYSFCGGPEVWMKVTLPPRDAMNDECRRVLAHAGLVLLCWQWMATPCRKIVCKATALTADQRQFWADFYREAFAEFALHNNWMRTLVTLRSRLNSQKTRSRSKSSKMNQ